MEYRPLNQLIAAAAPSPIRSLPLIIRLEAFELQTWVFDPLQAATERRMPASCLCDGVLRVLELRPVLIVLGKLLVADQALIERSFDRRLVHAAANEHQLLQCIESCFGTAAIEDMAGSASRRRETTFHACHLGTKTSLLHTLRTTMSSTVLEIVPLSVCDKLRNAHMTCMKCSLVRWLAEHCNNGHQHSRVGT